MPHLPDNLVPFYEDSLLWNQTPEEIEAERAYRDAFLDSAREAGTWIRIDYKAIDAAHAARRKIRETAEVLVPSSEYYQQPDLDSFQIAYRCDHLVATAKARGRAHGFEFVRQCWEELLKTGVDHHEIVEQCFCRDENRTGMDLPPELLGRIDDLPTWSESVRRVVWQSVRWHPHTMPTKRLFCLS